MKWAAFVHEIQFDHAADCMRLQNIEMPAATKPGARSIPQRSHCGLERQGRAAEFDTLPVA
jgi:hypothetical protein